MALRTSCAAGRAAQAASGLRPAAKAIAAAPAAPRRQQQQARNLQLRAAAADEVLDLDTVKLAGPSAAGDTPAEEQEFSIEELIEAAESTHLASLEVADIEAAFLAGNADEDTASYLSGLQAQAEALQLEGSGRAAEAATASLQAAAAELLESGDVPEAQVVEDLGVVPAGADEPDVLEGLSNDEAVKARKVVGALKLSREELADHVLPEDWDATTIEWFSNREEDELPLPEYKLAFLWMDKNIAVAVDQVYARGNTSPLTEYFVWPRKDAWEDLKMALEGRPWISDRDKVLLLNRLTEVINFWMGTQEERAEDGTVLVAAVKPSIEEARATFPDCDFAGTL